MSFQPDYHNIEDAARNKVSARLPLYEHIVNTGIMEAVLDTPFGSLRGTDNTEFFRLYSRFFLEMGYDTVSFECSSRSVFPGGGALDGHKKGIIQTREDFEKYPWDSLEERYFERYDPLFEALGQTMPEGMKGIGGVGNGVFECVQDLVGYMDLCFMREDDPELYRDLFFKVGDYHYSLWKRFLREYADIYCVCRFGDDLGFKSNTLISGEDIRELVIPQYRRIIGLVHDAGKPFLLHSCGNIFSVMDDLIAAGIDAKHSNEDQIAYFPVWVEKYGDRIGNFGGIDTDAVCRLPEDEMRKYIEDVVSRCQGHGGFAFGSGNSIPDYVPVDQYLRMNRIIRTIRGESL